MRYRMLCLGKIRERYVAGAVDDFAQRLQRYDPLEVVELHPANGSDRARAVREESESVLRRLEPGDHVWLLERNGIELSSTELSGRLAKLAMGGVSRVTLVICGPFGASESLIQRANLLWSLSRLTLLHEWVRALVLEQLYRAAKIERGEPYHH